MRTYLRAIAIVFFCCICLNAKATHVVGGDLYYDLIHKTDSSNFYHITLKLYLDCENGLPSAIAEDSSAVLGVFDCDKDTTLIKKFEHPHHPPTLISALNYKCVKPNPNACVSENIFEYEMELMHNKSGYYLSFQRCCRNRILNNIVDPLSTGANYHIFIPGTDVEKHNSSARFKELPPNYLCNDLRLDFDHSAFDPDGDSLVYSLFHPYTGGNRIYPRPNPPAEPPLENVFWRSPFDVNNMMGGKEKLTIDPVTGRLTVLPDQVGQYVVGIKVQEFRNGKFIGETLRDYQFYVRKCEKEITADFEAAVNTCSDTVRFFNISRNANDYEWIFKDEGVTLDTSLQNAPTYIFPGDGEFNVYLVAKDDKCVDTIMYPIVIGSNIKVEAPKDTVLCDLESINFQTQKVNKPQGGIIFWSNGFDKDYTIIQDTGTYWVGLNYGKCTVYDTFFVEFENIPIQLSSALLLCPNQVDTTLRVNNLDYTHYKWMDNPNENNSFFQVHDTGTYWVETRTEYCTYFDTTQVFPINFKDLGDTSFLCLNGTVELKVPAQGTAYFVWDDASEGQERTVDSAGIYWVETTYDKCSYRSYFEIKHPDISVGYTYRQCPEALITINESDSIGVDFKWVINGREEVEGYAPEVPLDYGLPESLFLVFYYGDICSDTLTLAVDTIEKVDSPIRFYNVFTPNNDGYNDCFKFESEVEGCTEVYWAVYSRWGEKVFESETLLDCWSGTNIKNGNVYPEGTYFWIARFKDEKKAEYTGTVELIRD